LNEFYARHERNDTNTAIVEDPSMQQLFDKQSQFEAKFGFSPEMDYLDWRTEEAYLAYVQRLDEALKTGKPGQFKPRPDRPEDLSVD
jgi:hypothetical protein